MLSKAAHEECSSCLDILSRRTLINGLPVGASVPAFFICLAGGEGVVAGRLDEVACVVEGEDADVVAAADLEPVDAAVRCDEPRRLFCRAVDRAHQVQRHKTDRAGVRKYRDLFALMPAEYFPQNAGRSAKELAIALAVRNYVMDVAVYECVIIFWKITFGFVKGKAFEHADVTFAE